MTNFPGLRDGFTNAYPEMRESFPLPDDGAVWYGSDASDAYGKQHHNSYFRLGFKEGRLVGVHVWIGIGGGENHDKRKKLLGEFLDGYKRLCAVSATKRFPLQDDFLRVRCHPHCSWEEHFAAGIRITAPAR